MYSDCQIMLYSFNTDDLFVCVCVDVRPYFQAFSCQTVRVYRQLLLRNSILLFSSILSRMLRLGTSAQAEVLVCVFCTCFNMLISIYPISYIFLVSIICVSVCTISILLCYANLSYPIYWISYTISQVYIIYISQVYILRSLYVI